MDASFVATFLWPQDYALVSCSGTLLLPCPLSLLLCWTFFCSVWELFCLQPTDDACRCYFGEPLVGYRGIALVIKADLFFNKSPANLRWTIFTGQSYRTTRSASHTPAHQASVGCLSTQ
jgi:hypothetical protein